MKGMKLTRQSIGIKSALSLVAFICYTYLVLSNDMGKLFYYVVIAYSLTSLYIILPAIWVKDSIRWRIRFPVFITLFCLSWVVSFVMIYLSSAHVLATWLQWTMLVIAYLMVVFLSFCYRYDDDRQPIE